MSQFRPLAWSLARAEAELSAFKAWFAGRTFLGETEIVNEIAGREHMCGLLAATAGFSAPDLIGRELTLRGLFRTDLVLGNDALRQFALIEFEPALSNSIFAKRQTAQYRHWSAQIEHGFSQVIDWAWIMADAPNDIVLNAAFGGRINASAFIVVCGRDAGIRDLLEEGRFNHRQNAVRIAGVPARIMTYDGMVKDLELNLAVAKSFSLP